MWIETGNRIKILDLLLLYLAKTEINWIQINQIKRKYSQKQN